MSPISIVTFIFKYITICKIAKKSFLTKLDQKKELDKRMDRIANGETSFSTWADVKKRLRS